MLNFACDPPPEALRINGHDYSVQSDFRVWIEIGELFRELNDERDPAELTRLVLELENLAFGDLLAEPWQEVLAAMQVFLRGYPQADNGYSGDGDAERTFSFRHDINAIVVAFRNQSGIDLSYRRKEPFHWWLFLLEFQTLESRHAICELMRTRGYKGKDPDMLRAKRAAALPEEHTQSEQRTLDELDALFFNA